MLLTRPSHRLASPSCNLFQLLTQTFSFPSSPSSSTAVGADRCTYATHPLLAPVAVHAMRPLFRRLPLISPCDLIPKPPNFRGVLRAASQFKLCRLKQRGILPLLFCLSSHLRPRLKLSSTARTQRGPRTTRCRFLDSLPRSVRLLASTYLPPGPYSLTGRSSVRGCHARLWQIINRRSVPLNRGRPHRKYRSPIQKQRGGRHFHTNKALLQRQRGRASVARG